MYRIYESTVTSGRMQAGPACGHETRRFELAVDIYIYIYSVDAFRAFVLERSH